MTQGSRQSFSNLQATMVWEKNLRRDEGIHYLEGRESTRVEPKPSLNVRHCLKWRITQWPQRSTWLHFACVVAKAFTSQSNSSAGFCNTFSCVSVKYDFISWIHLFNMRGAAVEDPREPALFPRWFIWSSCFSSSYLRLALHGSWIGQISILKCCSSILPTWNRKHFQMILTYNGFPVTNQISFWSEKLKLVGYDPRS